MDSYPQIEAQSITKGGGGVGGSDSWHSFVKIVPLPSEYLHVIEYPCSILPNREKGMNFK
jgi:hypothetical protein